MNVNAFKHRALKTGDAAPVTAIVTSGRCVIGYRSSLGRAMEGTVRHQSSVLVFVTEDANGEPMAVTGVTTSGHLSPHLNVSMAVSDAVTPQEADDLAADVAAYVTIAYARYFRYFWVVVDVPDDAFTTAARMSASGWTMLQPTAEGGRRFVLSGVQFEDTEGDPEPGP